MSGCSGQQDDIWSHYGIAVSAARHWHTAQIVPSTGQHVHLVVQQNSTSTSVEHYNAYHNMYLRTLNKHYTNSIGRFVTSTNSNCKWPACLIYKATQ